MYSEKHYPNPRYTFPVYIANKLQEKLLKHKITRSLVKKRFPGYLAILKYVIYTYSYFEQKQCSIIQFS